MGASQFGYRANRCHAFARLGYPHILVQVASYDGGYVQLDVWNHVVSGWRVDTLVQELRQIADIEITEGQDAKAVAHFLLKDRRILAVQAPVTNTHERNAALRKVVAAYQRSAILNRTALKEPDDIWPLYPDAIAIVMFPRYQPADIIAAARYRAFLPPGISRHIVHGRALRVNYPLEALRNRDISLQEKNERLKTWMQTRISQSKIAIMLKPSTSSTSSHVPDC
jgi:hypothetical protein